MEYKGLAAIFWGILRKSSESEPKNFLHNAKESGIVSDFNSESYVCINGYVGLCHIYSGFALPSNCKLQNLD
jgi:hypothetical protein